MSGASHTVVIGPLAVRFSGSEPQVLERLRSLFAAFPLAEHADHEVVVERASRGDAAGWRATIDGEPVRWADHLALIEESLTRRINRMVLDAEPDRLHLHAGGVERNGRVVLVVGPSGSGKSTLVAAMATAGWRVLSDEQLGVLPDGLLVPYPRPVTVRRNSWSLIQGLDTADLPRSVQRLEVPVGSLGGAYVGPPIAPRLIVVPDVSTDRRACESLTAAETLSALLVDTLDLERAGDDGLRALLALVESAPGIRIRGTDLTTTISEIERLVIDAVAPGQVVRESCGTGHVGDPRRASSLAWLFPDGSSAIHETSGGALAVVDAAGFEAWQALHAPPEEWPPGLAESAFVNELVEAGIVERPVVSPEARATPSR